MAPHTEEELKKLKVVDLKELLKAAELPVSGKKDELIQRLLEAEATEEEVAAEEVAPAEAEVEEEEPAGEPIQVDEEPAPPPSAPPPPPPEDAPAPPPIPEPTPTSASNGHARPQGDDEPTSKRVKVDDDNKVLVVSDPHEGEVLAVEPVVEKSLEGVEETVQQGAEAEEEEQEPPVYDFEPEDEALGRPTDMYLDTVTNLPILDSYNPTNELTFYTSLRTQINRTTLDFDFERLCSVTLSHNNIYACLTDGKYFQGRGKSSPAYAHSIAEDHHVYINLTTQKVYVLPDGYEVNDPSLDDIKYLLFPTFTPSLLTRIDATIIPSFDLSLTPYYPGFIGLNNIKSNSYMNSIIHSLLHVVPLRNYFILSPDASPINTNATELVKRFSMLARKIWNPKAFKGQVSPHEFLQECSNRSEGRFKITEVGDPIEFLGWLLNTLHKDLGGSKKSRSSIIYSAFQGEVRVDDQQVLTTGEFGGKPRFDLDRGAFSILLALSQTSAQLGRPATDIKSTRSPFLFLALDLPPPPLFQDAISTNIIPQVPISTVLSKYDGITTQEAKGIIRRYKVLKLPPYLILHVKRFTKNNFVEEKNPTIMNFPLRGVDMRDYVDPPSDLATYYDLVSNITHSSAAGTAREETTWKTQVHLRPERESNGKLKPGLTEDDEKWFQIQDLIVGEINREMIPLGESYIQIWERRSSTGTNDLVVETKAKKDK